MGTKWEMIWLGILTIAMMCITISRGIGAGLTFAAMDLVMIVVYTRHFRNK